MPVEITNAFANLQATLAEVPPALYAIILLGGPTAAWILYRLLITPRARRYAAEGGDLLWICENCRSANERRQSHCYRCGYDRARTVGDLQVVDGSGLVALGHSGEPAMESRGPGIPVGPGRPSPTEVDPGPIEPVITPIPALVARPEVKAPRRAVTSSQVRASADVAVATEERPD